METKYKQLHTGTTKAAGMADAEWEKIKGLMVNPDKFEPEQVRVFESQLAHNFIDRDGERFSKDVLKSFARSIVGKSVLTGHNWGALGSGRVFDAKLEKATIEETLAMIGPNPEKGLSKHLAKVAETDGGIYWLVTKYYMLADDPMVQMVDAGIVQDMSIGFRAPERVEVKNDDKAAWREYRNTKDQDAEALEQSFVFLGSQYGARTRKDFDGTEDEPKNDEVEMMKVEFKTLGEFELTEETKAAMVEAIEAKVAEAEAKAAAAENMLAEFKAAAGCEDVEAVKALVVKANATHDALVAEVVKYGALCGLIAPEKVEERKAALAAMPDGELEVRLEEYKAVWSDRNPPAGKLPEAKEEKKENKPAGAGSLL